MGDGAKSRGRRTLGALLAMAALAVGPLVAAPPVAATTGKVIAVGAGDGQSCAATDADEVLCWGDNSSGQLGTGTTVDSHTPTPVATAGTPLAGQTVTQFALGATHSCALSDVGSVSCWGDGSGGLLGNGASTDSLVPVAVSTAGVLNGTTVTQISTGYLHTCARTSDGTAVCWGSNFRGELGDGTTTDRNVPVAVTTIGTPLEGKTITQVSAGSSHSCALTEDGLVACWGHNQAGKLGNGTTVDSSVPVAVSMSGFLAGKTITRLAAGAHHTCVATADRVVACWGGAPAVSLVPQQVPAPPGGPLVGKTIAELESGSGTTCARTTDHVLACWGFNASGLVGDGTTNSAGVPTAVTTAGTPLAGKPLARLSVGEETACAVTTDGTVACWGTNWVGQVGDGSSGRSLLPNTPAAGALTGATIQQIAAGGDATCARTSTGSAACWGFSPGGLGSGSGVSAVPVAVATAGTPIDGLAMTSITVGDSFACAVVTGGIGSCWGDGGFGQLGRGSTSDAAKPVLIETGGTPLQGKAIAQISAGTAHVCALTTDNVLACWGANFDGRVGNGGAVNATRPTAVTTTGTALAGKTVISVAAGASSTCALASDNTIACWGTNTFGELGNDTTTASKVAVPVTLAGTPLAGKTITQIRGGDSDHFCALASGSTLACWGSNTAGEIGDGTKFNRKKPTAVISAATPLAGKTIGEVQLGSNRSCARTTDSTIACWGTNDLGGIGDGTIVERTTPSAVAAAGTPLAGQTVTGLALAKDTACALTATSLVSCWGDNFHGQHGNGTVGYATTPRGVQGWTGIPATVPGPPTIWRATAGNGQATVSWSAPASNGGSMITSYVVTPYIGNVAQSPVASSGAGTWKVVTGLTNGTSYSFTVAAVNGIGAGAASARSNVVTPLVPPPAYAPFGSWSAFVRRQYVDLTTANPSTTALNTWVAALGNGSKTKGDLIEALRRGTDNTVNVDPTARLYRAFLGRAPDKGGLEFWIKRRRTGTWTLTRIADSFAGSNEFKTKYGTLTNRQFVTRIYTDVLGRTADPAGVDYWTRQLDLRRRNRGSVMVGFSESSEYKRKQAENTDVAVAYIFLMGRVPTAGETTDWTTRQKAGTTQAELATELLNSNGYAARITG